MLLLTCSWFFSDFTEFLLLFRRFCVLFKQKQSLKGEITMKTQEELNALKNEVETLNKKLAELTEEELAQVTGGGDGLPWTDGGSYE